MLRSVIQIIATCITIESAYFLLRSLLITPTSIVIQILAYDKKDFLIQSKSYPNKMVILGLVFLS